MVSIIGWTALIVLMLFFVVLVYIDTSSKKLFKLILETVSSEEAKIIKKKGFYKRLRWLGTNKNILSENHICRANRLLALYNYCKIMAVVLVILHIISLVFGIAYNPYF